MIKEKQKTSIFKKVKNLFSNNSFQRINNKRKLAKINFNIKFILFYFVVLFFTVSVKANSEQNPDFVLSNIFAVLSPSSFDSAELNPTYASADLNIYLTLITTYINNCATSLFIAGFFWFFIKMMIDLMMSVKNQANRIRVLIFGFCLLLLSPLFTIETTNNGITSEKTMLNYLFDNFIAETVVKMDEQSTINTEQLISVPSVKIQSPKNLRQDFTKISNTYLLSFDSSNKEEETLSIAFADDQYRAEFELGGTKTKITLNSSVMLNEQAKLLGIDLEQKEKEFVKSYFSSMLENAEKLGEKIANLEHNPLDRISGDFQDFDNTDNEEIVFNKDYQYYCADVYSYSLAGATRKTANTYFQIASSCASQNFFIEQYQNDFYDVSAVYNKTSTLRNNNVALFGENNPTGNYENLKSLAIQTCKTGGYLACAEAVQFISFHNNEVNQKLGVLITPVRIVNELASSIVDGTDDLFETKMFEENPSSVNGFRDYVSDSKALYNLTFSLKKEKTPDLIMNAYDLFDFEKIAIPDFDDITNIINGEPITLPFERLRTCFFHTDEFANGFKCNKASKEAVDFGVALIKTGVSIKLANTVFGMTSSKSNLVEGAVIGKIASSGASKQAIGAVVGVLSPQLMSNPTKDDPYFNADTVSAMIGIGFVASLIVPEMLVIMGSAGSWLIAMGIGILTIIYLPIIYLFLSAFRILFELIIDAKILMLKIFTKTLDNQITGLSDIYKELIAEICQLFFILNFILLFSYIQNSLLLMNFQSIFKITDLMKESAMNIVIHSPSLILQIIIQVVVMLLLSKFIVSMTDKILQKIKE